MALWDRLLDASVFWSFDRSGFLRHSRAFDPGALEVDLRGKHCLITGANSGIGLETASALAARGASVWMLCRSEARGRAAEAALRSQHPGADLRLELLDVGRRSSIEAFVARAPLPGAIHALIHNAGVLPDVRRLTEDGVEETWATNVFGPHMLTTRLLGRLSGGRVLTVYSGGMYLKRLALREIDDHERRFDGVDAYANTKRAEAILNRLWPAHAQSVQFHAMHPGWADTPAVQTSLPRFHRLMKGRLRTAAEGADTLVWLAALPEIPGPNGTLWFDRQPAPEHLSARTQETPEEGFELWRRCQEFSRMERR
ncbi:MAG: SDR family NAD(P)-dependent oxidoreductase [Myxococcota bacterium]